MSVGRVRGVVFVLLCAGLLPAAAMGQEFRGTITGRVIDYTGGVVPGVTVTATNAATNVKSSTTTTAEGTFSIPYLNPGTYAIAAALSGFKTASREAIELRIGDRISLDFKLEIGRVEEVVSVTAEAPLLEMSHGSAGQVIDEKRIALLPLSDGNPFVLTRLVPGVAYTGDLKFSRPFDNAGTSSITADGATGGNEFSLDGSPNMASGRRVAFVPPAGAVQEFKVSTASFDAADGHSAGAMVNVTLKSGTNTYKGEAYHYLRRDKFEATDFFVLKAQQAKPKVTYDRWGGFLGGPVLRNRTFAFAAIEWLYDEFPEPGPRTVPSEAMRRGDFSELLARTSPVVIYDPRTAVQSGARVVRQPFPGNIIPADRISPIAANILKYYPLPNQAGTQGQDNYFSTNPRSDSFYSISTRVDHQITEKQHAFVRYTRNNRRESRGAYFGDVNGVIPTGNYLFRVNDGVTFDDVYTVTPMTVLDVRAGWQRFQEPNIRQHQDVFDPATLGFASNVTSLFNGARYFPVMSVGSLSQIGDNLAASTVHSIYSFQPTLTRVMGRHSLRAGYDARLYKESSSNRGRLAPEFTFGSNFTRAQDNSTNLFGQDIAALLLGQPTGGSIDRNAERLNSTLYHGVFIQDDWKVSPRLTVNLGLRYELEAATTEADNRNVRGFDPNAPINIAAAAKTQYAVAPIAELPASAFDPKGGLVFASDSNRGFWNTDGNNIQPRVGFAFSLNDKTVLRGGTGIYAVPLIISGILQPGFSQSTSLVPSDNLGLTFNANLANPFPAGVLTPAGASAGANTGLGQTVGRFIPLDMKNPQNARYSIGVQRELPSQWLLDVAFTGSRGWDQTTDLDLNPTPARYLSTRTTRDQATIDFLAQQVTNPFRNLVPGQGINGSITRGQLLRPFPQYTGVTTNATDGRTNYKSLQVKLEHRFVKGYTLLVGYTASRFTETSTKLNATDTSYETRPAAADVPHRLSLSAIWELPFGEGRRWGGGNSLKNALVGNWSVQAIGQFQSGIPIDFGNVYFNGDMSSLKTSYSDNTDLPVFDVSGFYFHDAAVQTNGVDDPVRQRADSRIQLASNIRTFPSRIDGVRSPALKTWDISLVKQVGIKGRVRAQLNIEILNAFNQVYFNNANTTPTNVNFGKVTSQNNLPRELQIAWKLVF